MENKVLEDQFFKAKFNNKSNNIGSMIYQNIFLLPDLINLDWNGKSTTPSLSLFFFFGCVLFVFVIQELGVFGRVV